MKDYTDHISQAKAYLFNKNYGAAYSNFWKALIISQISVGEAERSLWLISVLNTLHDAITGKEEIENVFKLVRSWDGL